MEKHALNLGVKSLLNTSGPKLLHMFIIAWLSVEVNKAEVDESLKFEV